MVPTNLSTIKGYIVPEYVVHGKLREKVDVYSYEIFVLDIMSGRK